jgi:HSP20 family protein
MWSEALSMLDRAERLQRQFFHHRAASEAVSWIPPVDVLESAEHVEVHVALPGVAADTVTIGLDAGGVTISAARAFPCRGDGTSIHRIEIPYGRFERQIGLPLGELELVEKRLADGLLTLVFLKKGVA